MTDPSDYRLLRISQEGRVRLIEMNVAEKRNPVGFAMAEELHDAVTKADKDDGVHCIIIGAVGKIFSGGHDLSPEGVQDYIDKGGTPETMWSSCEDAFFRKMGLDIWNTDTPTIARVQGAAVLGGFSLANVCDLIVASEEAMFWSPSARMHGFAAEIFMEPWVMGGGRRAKEHLFTGEQMTAAEAYRVGMVNRVVPREELESATMALAQTIAKNPKLGLKMCKRAVNETMNAQGLRQALDQAFLLHTFSKWTGAYQEETWKPMVAKIQGEGLGSYLKRRDDDFKE